MLCSPMVNIFRFVQAIFTPAAVAAEVDGLANAEISI